MFAIAMLDMPPPAHVIIAEAPQDRPSRSTLDVSLPQAGTLLAQTNPGSAGAAAKQRAIGFCTLAEYIPSPGEQFGGESLEPEVLGVEYFFRYEKRQVTRPQFEDVTLISPPTHGKLTGQREYVYLPEPGYLGDDRVIFTVKVDGTTVRVVYLIKVTDQGVDRPGIHDLLCKKTGVFWKISGPGADPAALPAPRDYLPEKGHPLALYAVSPRTKFIVWWADAKGQNRTNHFPTFKSVASESELQYCRFDPAFVQVTCSTELGGQAKATYTRQARDARLVKQLLAETDNQMTAMHIYKCTTGCTASVPKQFALMLHTGAD